MGTGIATAVAVVVACEYDLTYGVGRGKFCSVSDLTFFFTSLLISLVNPHE